MTAKNIKKASWFLKHYKSQEFKKTTENVRGDNPNPMCPPDETAMILGLINYFKPQMCLEIGTFFAETTYLIAEAIAKNKIGKIITIDPYGANRVPEIIEKWPNEIKSVSEFRGENSMAFFDWIENQSKLPSRSLDFVFVDGNHKFEYAAFDIFSAAANLSPNGVIVIDNIEQMGPRAAVLDFCAMNPSWTCFFAGKLFREKELETAFLQIKNTEEVSWAILIGPENIPVPNKGFKQNGDFFGPVNIPKMTLNVVRIKEPIRLNVNLQCVGIPHDFHITSKGLFLDRRTVDIQINSAKKVDIVFNPPITVESERKDYNYLYELELTPLSPSLIELFKDAPFEFSQPHT